MLKFPRRTCATCGQSFSALHFHHEKGARQCRACFVTSRATFLSRGGIEAGRSAWAMARSAAYFAVFLWWASGSSAHPMRALLSGVFFADVGTWFLFSFLQLPFRGLAFAAEFSVYAILGTFVMHASPDSLAAVGPSALIYAGLGFFVTFTAKCFLWLWTRLVDEL